MTGLHNAALFLINAIMSLYLFALAIRLVLAYARVNYFNPMTQIIITLTQKLITPTRRFLPTYRGIEWATLFWLVVLSALRIYITLLFSHSTPPLITLLIFAAADAGKLILNVYFYAILLRALLSWIQHGHSPMGQLLDQVTLPIMQPIRRILPPVQGIDLSPIPALIILQTFIILLP